LSEVYALDSFAILALLGREKGSDVISNLLHQVQAGEARALMTWVNVGEVAYIVERRWGKGRLYQVLGNLEASGIEFVSVGRDLALSAAEIKAKYPLACADAFSAALAMDVKGTLITGDPELKVLEKIVSIRWTTKQ
jgi:predicted nucleic acid-binding protein